MPPVDTQPKPFDTPLSGAPVQGDPWAFDVVLITEGPGNPVGKYYYTQEFIDDPQTAAIYNGAQGFIDHDGEMDAANRPERSMRDLFCWYDQVHPEGNALKARQHIIPSKENEFWCDVVSESIRYRELFPDKNLCGLSVVQRGETEAKDYNGDTWKFVKNATAVKSVDLVTLPARGGMILKPADGQAQCVRDLVKTWMMESMRSAKEEMQKQSGQSGTPFAAFTRPTDKSKEAEDGTPDLMGSLKGMRDLIEAADDSMPLKLELRRGLDNAITAASKKNKETTMPEGALQIKHDPAPAAAPAGQPAAQPSADENARAMHGKASETFATLAEGCSDPVMKKQYQSMAEGYKALAVSPAKSSEAEKETEEESEEEGEESFPPPKGKKGKASESEEESESMRLERLETNDLMRESGVTGTQAEFLLAAMKGKPLAERKGIIKKFQTAFSKESASFNAPARQVVGGGKSPFASKFDEFNKKGGR